MTPEEILLELRDIHLPPEPAGAALSPSLAPEPILLALALLAALVLVARRRATRWRRQGRARLAALRREPSEARAFEGMTALAAGADRRRGARRALGASCESAGR